MDEYPPEVIAAIDAALDELPDPENPFERDRWRIVSRVVLHAIADAGFGIGTARETTEENGEVQELR